ncbi:MAG: GNAT family N-acetyltransferase [Anaerolineae bacterium]|nr:GNAT family N-acetyltransferase [Anaerolineae bacterium]
MVQIIIDTLQPQYAQALEQLQIDCFPTLAYSERLREEHFLKQCELCPECNFVALAEGQVVGLGGGFFTDFNFAEPGHTFMEILAGGYYTNHQPHGAYYYGADISVHPAFRRRGIGGLLYEARKSLVVRANRRGIVAGGLIPGFAAYKRFMTVHDYVDKVLRGELYDSTLSFQLHQGFRAVELLENYIEDSASDNWSVLIVWDNHSYRP